MTRHSERPTDRIFISGQSIMEGYTKLRFNVNELDYLKTCQQIAVHCDRALFYFHPDGKRRIDGKVTKPHVHGLIVNYKKTDDTLRKLMKKNHNLKESWEHEIGRTFGPAQNKIRMTDKNYHGYIVYMTKGKYDPILVKDFLHEEATLAKSLYKEPELPIQVDILKGETLVRVKSKKKTMFQLSKEAEIKYLDTYGFDSPIDYDALADTIADVMEDNGTIAHYRNVAYIIQDIQASRHTDLWHSQIKKMCGLNI